MKLRALTLTTALTLSLGLPAAAEIQTRTITVSNGVAETHPVGNGVEAMRECMAERTDGKWTLNAFWSGALGGDLDATQALRSGTQEMVITSTSPLVGIEPALGVFDLPFLFSSAEEADAVLEGVIKSYEYYSVAYDRSGLASEYRATVILDLTLRKRGGEVLWKENDLNETKTYRVSNVTAMSESRKDSALREIAALAAGRIRNRFFHNF